MGRILVVDDEKEIADLLEVYLQNDGYTVIHYTVREFFGIIHFWVKRMI